MGSRGSVVPIFKQQIAAGGPICVTHPEVKRYFMTIPEAVQLVLQAAAMGEGGEIFVLDMGEPVKIVDLARDLIRLSGMQEGRDIDIQFTGLQRGEKIAEELFFTTERVEKSSHEKILVCRNGFKPRLTPRGADAGFGASEVTSLRTVVERLVIAAQTGATKNVRALIKQLVPEFQENIEIPAMEIIPIERGLKSGHALVEERQRI